MEKYSSVFMKEESFAEEYDKEIKKLNQKILSKTNDKVKKDDKFIPTFASVGGQDEAIKQLKKKLVYPIQYPEAYKYYKNKVVRYDSYIIDKICAALDCNISDLIEYVK